MLNRTHVRTCVTVPRSGARGELWELCRDESSAGDPGRLQGGAGCPLSVFSLWLQCGEDAAAAGTEKGKDEALELLFI